MNLKNAEKIGRFLGELEVVDEDANNRRVRKFLQIRVRIDMSLKLKTGCMITRDDGSLSWVQFKYERLPEFCYRCGKIDHVEKACSMSKGTGEMKEGEEFGAWLRAQPPGVLRHKSREQAHQSPEVVNGSPEESQRGDNHDNALSGTVLPISAQPRVPKLQASDVAQKVTPTHHPLQNITNIDFNIPPKSPELLNNNLMMGHSQSPPCSPRSDSLSDQAQPYPSTYFTDSCFPNPMDTLLYKPTAFSPSGDGFVTSLED